MFSIPCKDQNTNSHFNTLMLREKNHPYRRGCSGIGSSIYPGLRTDHVVEKPIVMGRWSLYISTPGKEMYSQSSSQRLKRCYGMLRSS